MSTVVKQGFAKIIWKIRSKKKGTIGVVNTKRQQEKEMLRF